MAFKAGSIYGDANFNTAGWLGSLSKLVSSTQFAAAAAAAAFVAAVVKITKETNKFEKGMANVSTLIDDTSVDIKQMGKELLLLDSRLGSATQNTEALYQALSAGVEAGEAVDFVADAAIFAAAALTDTATSVDVLTTALNAYGLEAEQAADVSDIFFTTIKQGKINGEQLSAVIGQSIPLFSSAGIALEELASGIAAMTKQGVSASESTTQLNAIVNSFLKPSEELTAILTDLGYASGAAFLEAEGLAGALKLIEDQTKGDAAAMAQLLPNIRALRGAMALTGVGGEEFVAIMAEMEERSGATAEAFEKQELSFQSLSNAFSNSMVAIGQSFFGTTSDMITELVILVDEFTAWAVETETIGTALDSFMSVVALAVNLIGDLGKLLEPLVSTVFVAFGQELEQARIIVESLIDTLTTNLAGAIDVLSSFVEIMGKGALTIFKQLIATGILDLFSTLASIMGDLIAIRLELFFAKMLVKVEWAVTVFTILTEVLRPLFTLIGWIAEGLKVLTGGLSGLDVLEKISGVFETIRKGVQIVSTFVQLLAGPAFQTAGEAISAVFEHIGDGLKFVGKFIKTMMGTLGAFLDGFFEGMNVFTLFNKKLEFVLGTVYTIIQSFKLIGEAAKLALDPANWGTGAILDSIDRQFALLTSPERRQAFVSSGMDLIGGLTEGMGEKWNEAIDTVNALYEEMNTAAEDGVQQMAEVQTEAAEEQLEQLEEQGENLLETNQEILDGLLAEWEELNRATIDGENAAYQERLAMLQGFHESGQLSTEQYQSLTAKAWTDHASAIVKTIKSQVDMVAGIMSFGFNKFSQLSGMHFQNELDKTELTYRKEQAALQKRFDDGLISEAEFNAESERLKKEKQQKENKIRKQQFETEKALSTAQVFVDLASGVMAAWSTSMAFGPIAGPILAAAATAALVGISVAELALISQQQFVPAAEIGGMTTAPGGVQVNEKGGEIMRFPTGSVIIPNDISEAFAAGAGSMAGGGMNNYFNFEGMIVDSPERAEQLTGMIIERMGRELNFANPVFNG